MKDDGEMKDDVRMPEGEVGAKITKMFKEDEKETRRFCLDQILEECNN
jgi:translation initiation factor 5A